ncbi:hypothetical protein [Desulfopila inferna]|uniref:hypothetical protein n=1 Tax=Desulfopila inferna TaxID=468528 RepID=UPI00196402D3|nr:hypothetical protein [Desulfopila inferna]MBM9606206.1 hypothetical protein [Desulfopila inferna]
MRCPKCGFISFDHVEACLKCSKDITKFASDLEGTTYNVKPPSFLKFQKGGGRAQTERSGISFDAEDEYDVVDPDLNVLVEEDEDNEIAFNGGLDFDDLAEEENFEIALGDDDSDDEGIDLGQFEDAFAEEEPDIGGHNTLSMDLPDELNDISDLSAPSTKDVGKQRKNPGNHSGGDDFDDFSLDLDIGELDDDEFSLTSSEDADQTESDGLENLSFDDLGLSEAEEVPAPPTKKEHGEMDMDADLDFDLDLGGISLDKDE